MAMSFIADADQPGDMVPARNWHVESNHRCSHPWESASAAGFRSGSNFLLNRNRTQPLVLHRRGQLRKSLQSFKRVIAEYGVVALVIHYIVFAIVIVSAYLAMNAGWQPSGRMAGAGTWAAAYVVAKITQPVRLIVTVALAPLAARLYGRLSGRDVRNGKCPMRLPVALGSDDSASERLPLVAGASATPAPVGLPLSCAKAASPSDRTLN